MSGGQRARVALARAVYSQARILMLDDPLSALDHQTAENIVRKCFAGPLLENRTTILVTHRTDLCLPFAKQIVMITDGRASVLDPVAALSDSSSTLRRNSSTDMTNEEAHKRQDEQEVVVPEKFLEDEHRAHGGVKFSVYWEYIKAGKLRYWAILTIVLALYRLIDIGETWFLKSWSEKYNEPTEMIASNPLDRLPSPEDNIRPWLLGFFILGLSISIVS